MVSLTEDMTTQVFLKYLKIPDSTIIDIARELDITIAKASNIVGNISDQSEKLKAIFERRKWPANISNGYIYDGKPKDISGGRGKFLFKGQFVLIEVIPTTDKKFKRTNYEIFLPLGIKEKEVKLYRMVQKDVKSIAVEQYQQTVWQPVKDHGIPWRQFKTIKDVLKDTGCSFYRETGRSRIRYITGQYAGVAHIRDLRPVNELTSRF